MKIINILLAATLCLLACADHEKNNSELPEQAQSKSIMHRQNLQDSCFVSFLDIDSIAVFDKSIEEAEIDSINILPLSFDAKYIGCFKANFEKNLYRRLKSIAPQKYRQIMAITTDHEIVKADLSYHFHGMENVDCNYPESSEVRIESTLYSLYSDLRLLGRIMIIDEIIKNPDSRRQDKGNGG